MKRIIMFLLGLCIPVSVFALEPVNPVVRVGQEIAERALTGETSALSALGDLSLKSSMEAAALSLESFSTEVVDMSATEMLPETFADTSMGAVPMEEFSPITLGMQGGALSGMEIPLGDSPSLLPTLSEGEGDFLISSPLGQKKDVFLAFMRRLPAVHDFKVSPLAGKIKSAYQEAQMVMNYTEGFWSTKGTVPDEQFYDDVMNVGILYGVYFSPTQLQEARAYYWNALSKEDMFSSQESFGKMIRYFLIFGFLADDALLNKMMELAKQAPEGRRFLTDFAAVRALLMQKRYDLLQGLMDFRLQQTGWEEVAPVYEELKLYAEKEQPLPLSFPEGMVARDDYQIASESLRGVHTIKGHIAARAIDEKFHAIEDYLSFKPNAQNFRRGIGANSN